MTGSERGLTAAATLATLLTSASCVLSIRCLSPTMIHNRIDRSIIGSRGGQDTSFRRKSTSAGKNADEPIAGRKGDSSATIGASDLSRACGIVVKVSDGEHGLHRSNGGNFMADER
jgi:hypothetical protein